MGRWAPLYPGYRPRRRLRSNSRPTGANLPAASVAPAVSRRRHADTKPGLRCAGRGAGTSAHTYCQQWRTSTYSSQAVRSAPSNAWGSRVHPHQSVARRQPFLSPMTSTRLKVPFHVLLDQSPRYVVAASLHREGPARPRPAHLRRTHP